jgi:HPt (histidine-containing phosphotransfer) domain-containing protein
VNSKHEIADLPLSSLDCSVLEELRGTFGSHSEQVANLYNNFLVHATRYIELLRSQSNEARATTLHTLKGSAAMMGAIRISAIAAGLHQAWQRNPEQPVEPAVRQLEEELAMFRHALAVHFAQ